MNIKLFEKLEPMERVGYNVKSNSISILHNFMWISFFGLAITSFLMMNSAEDRLDMILVTLAMIATLLVYIGALVINWIGHNNLDKEFEDIVIKRMEDKK